MTILLTQEEIRDEILKDKKRTSGWTPIITPRDFIIAKAQLRKIAKRLKENNRSQGRNHVEGQALTLSKFKWQELNKEAR